MGATWRTTGVELPNGESAVAKRKDRALAGERSSSRARSLHDERAVHAQERRRRTFDRPQLLLVSPELGRRLQVRCQRPVEDCDDNGSGQLDGRLLDREHHPAVLAAIAVVLLVAGSTRGSVRVGIGVSSCRVFVVRGVVLRRTVGVNMSHGRRLTARSRSFAGGTRAEPGVEVAAAEGHGDHQEEGHQKPEWTAAMEHTSPEYIGEHGTALRTSRFGIPRHGARMTVDRSSSGNHPPDQMPGADTRQGSGAAGVAKLLRF